MTAQHRRRCPASIHQPTLQDALVVKTLVESGCDVNVADIKVKSARVFIGAEKAYWPTAGRDAADGCAAMG
jgi:hypothetical protein